MTRAACSVSDGVIANPSQPTAMTLTGTYTMTLAANNGPIHYFDPGGSARTVNLYAANLAPGSYQWIINAADAAETITVKKADGSTTLCTVAQNHAVLILSDVVLGDWVFLANFTISLTSGA